MPYVVSYLSESQAIHNEEQLFLAFEREMKALGIDYICHFLISPVGPRSQSPYFHAFGNFPPAWADYYFANHFVEIDPIIKYARTATEAFHWYDLFKQMKMSKKAHAYLTALRDVGEFEDGITLPVYGPKGQVATFGFSKAKGKFDFDAQTMKLIKHLCIITHDRYVELTREHFVKQPELSQRESDVLHWVTRGKSDAVIAGILEISEHTVDTYLRRIYAKLDVSNRVEACVRGICLGLVLPA